MLGQAGVTAPPPKVVRGEAAEVRFKRVPDSKVVRLKERLLLEGEARFSMDFPQDVHQELAEGPRKGFQLTFRDGEKMAYWEPEPVEPDQEEPVRTDACGYSELLDVVCLVESGHEYRQFSIQWIRDGFREEVIEGPDLSPDGKWLVAAADYTDSDILASGLMVGELRDGRLSLVVDWEGEEMGYSMLGWIANDEALVSVSKGLADASGGLLYYKMRVRRTRR